MFSFIIICQIQCCKHYKVLKMLWSLLSYCTTVNSSHNIHNIPERKPHLINATKYHCHTQAKYNCIWYIWTFKNKHFVHKLNSLKLKFVTKGINYSNVTRLVYVNLCCSVLSRQLYIYSTKYVMQHIEWDSMLCIREWNIGFWIPGPSITTKLL